MVDNNNTNNFKDPSTLNYSHDVWELRKEYIIKTVFVYLDIYVPVKDATEIKRYITAKADDIPAELFRNVFLDQLPSSEPFALTLVGLACLMWEQYAHTLLDFLPAYTPTTATMVLYVLSIADECDKESQEDYED